jgi:hypothetical protein
VLNFDTPYQILSKKARSMAGFFNGVFQNDIGLRGAGTLTAACQSLVTAHHFTH